MDNNIYWFDSLERKRGILKNIDLSEFSKIATSSNFDNLVLYEDKRPECSASIACYEILKSYDGVIGQQLYSPRLKWKLLLDDVLPQYAVPYSDQYLQNYSQLNYMLDMCMIEAPKKTTMSFQARLLLMRNVQVELVLTLRAYAHA